MSDYEEVMDMVWRAIDRQINDCTGEPFENMSGTNREIEFTYKQVHYTLRLDKV